MPKTRRSLYYLATYLFLTGAAFFLAPQATLKLLLANHSYEDPFVQFTGVLMIGLSVVVVNVILFGNPKFYRATLFARIPMWVMILWIYIQTQDPIFIIVLSVLGLGILITGTSYLIERKQIGIS